VVLKGVVSFHKNRHDPEHGEDTGNNDLEVGCVLEDIGKLVGVQVGGSQNKRSILKKKKKDSRCRLQAVWLGVDGGDGRVGKKEEKKKGKKGGKGGGGVGGGQV